MYRTDADANVSNMFDPGDPMVPRQPTQVDAPWLNSIQEELAQAVTTAGLTLVKGVAQLPTVMANLTTAQNFTAVKTFARGLIGTMVAGATGFAATLTGAAGVNAGANAGIGGDAVSATGGAGDTTAVGGAGVRAVGGVGTAGPGSAGYAVRATGGFDGTVYAEALFAPHGGITLQDGGISVSKNLAATGTGSTIPGPASTALTLNAGVAAYAGFGGPGGITPGGWKGPDGVIHLEGTIVAAASSSYVAATLPAGLLSASGKRISCGQRHRMTSAHQGIVTIMENGDLQVDTDANGVVIDLSGIVFR